MRVDSADAATTLCLTPQQRDDIRRSCERAFPPDTTQSPSREQTQGAIASLYAVAGLRRPLFFWADNPRQMMQMAFLLQSIASVPHGAQRRQLRNNHIEMAPADFGWRLLAALRGDWQNSLRRLMGQLVTADLERLADDAHRDFQGNSQYCQPDLLSTCGSRLGFPAAPALAGIYRQLVRDAYGAMWTRWSANVTRELHALSREYLTRRVWLQRRGAEVAIAGDAFAGGFVRDWQLDLHSSPLPDDQMKKLFEIEGTILQELLIMQDTRCHHERVDGTSALKSASQTVAYSKGVYERLYESARNSIYMLTWGMWMQDELPLLQAVRHLNGGELYTQQMCAAIECFETMRAGAFLYIFNSKVVFACANPALLRWNEQQELHGWEEPAIEFADGSSWHFWRGIHLTAERISALKNHMDAGTIQQERNVELRRILVERYGAARYLQESGARVVHEDECGTLYRKDMAGDEPLVMVRVRNSTPEPDGTFKDYYLRVPPEVETARQAVAWTFSLEERDYRPTLET